MSVCLPVHVHLAAHLSYRCDSALSAHGLKPSSSISPLCFVSLPLSNDLIPSSTLFLSSVPSAYLSAGKTVLEALVAEGGHATLTQLDTRLTRSLGLDASDKAGLARARRELRAVLHRFETQDAILIFIKDEQLCFRLTDMAQPLSSPTLLSQPTSPLDIGRAAPNAAAVATRGRTATPAAPTPQGGWGGRGRHGRDETEDMRRKRWAVEEERGGEQGRQE